MFCLVILTLGELFLFTGTGVRDDVALLAMRPLLWLGGGGVYLLALLTIYLLVCGWFYRYWRRFLRSEEGVAQLANPAAGFPWPGIPQLPGQVTTAQAILFGGLVAQIIICAGQALRAVSAAHHAALLPHGHIRGFWHGIEVFRIGVAVAAFGAAVAALFYVRRLREKAIIRRILVATVFLFLSSGIAITIVGAKLQLDNPVSKRVHMEVLHPWPRHTHQ